MLLVLHSENSKVGDVAATYAPISQTCPSTCKLRDNGCYAQSGNVGFQVRRIERELDGANGDTVAVLEGDEIADMSRHAPTNHALRIHVSGDATSDFRALQLARGAKAWAGPVWSYTHAWSSVARRSWGRVSVLASCESVSQVILARSRGYAAALVVASHPADGRAYRDESGVKHIPCPSQTRDIKCTDCKLCWNDALLIAQGACIDFAVHGSTKKRALTVIQ
jgi:hypothetical protein